MNDRDAVHYAKIDGLVKSLQDRHSRLSAVPAQAGGNDENGCFLTFYEFVKIGLTAQFELFDDVCRFTQKDTFRRSAS